jgi:hypothetical protein
MNELDWLMSWYDNQCDGVWEHRYGVRIDTLDNPGWLLKVDLIGTSLNGRTFVKRESGLGGNSPWWSCQVTNDQWQGACGPRDLATVIGLFRQWAQQRTPDGDLK